MAEAYYKYGISAKGLRWVVDHAVVDADATTSDVCHRILKPATVGPGWENIPVLTDPQQPPQLRAAAKVEHLPALGRGAAPGGGRTRRPGDRA